MASFAFFLCEALVYSAFVNALVHVAVFRLALLVFVALLTLHFWKAPVHVSFRHTLISVAEVALALTIIVAVFTLDSWVAVKWSFFLNAFVILALTSLTLPVVLTLCALFPLWKALVWIMAKRADISEAISRRAVVIRFAWLTTKPF